MRVVLIRQAQDRVTRDMERLIGEVQALRSDVAEVKGYVRALPTTLQLLGFMSAVFVAAGFTRWFGH